MPVKTILLFLFCLTCYFPAVSMAAENQDYFDHYYLQAGTYTHYTSSEDHAGPDIFVAAEAVRNNDYLYGLALFDNSFGQFSEYLYTGKSWYYHGALEGFHTKVTAGLIHGYHGEFQDKIPLNNYGIAPAIIPGVGYSSHHYGADVIMLGLSGLLFTVGMDL